MGYRQSFTLKLLLVLALGATSCMAHGRAADRRTVSEVTGSCDGACDHYLACKGTESASAQYACVAECREIYEDPFTLAHFESLECADAIEFVEGPSGRGPGQTLARPN